MASLTWGACRSGAVPTTHRIPPSARESLHLIVRKLGGSGEWKRRPEDESHIRRASAIANKGKQLPGQPSEGPAAPTSPRTPPASGQLSEWPAQRGTGFLCLSVCLCCEQRKHPQTDVSERGGRWKERQRLHNAHPPSLCSPGVLWAGGSHAAWPAEQSRGPGSRGERRRGALPSVSGCSTLRFPRGASGKSGTNVRTALVHPGP